MAPLQDERDRCRANSNVYIIIILSGFDDSKSLDIDV
jgi:hypothetical protein